MTDKMPTNIWVDESQNIGHPKMCQYEYTLVHNNPEYHVIKKSDVEGDALKALNRLKKGLNHYGGNLSGRSLDRLDYDTVYNALIAQSDPDMVRIPRKWNFNMDECPPNEVVWAWFPKQQEVQECIYGEADNWYEGHAPTAWMLYDAPEPPINDVLNYKEGDDV